MTRGQINAKLHDKLQCLTLSCQRSLPRSVRFCPYCGQEQRKAPATLLELPTTKQKSAPQKLAAPVASPPANKPDQPVPQTTTVRRAHPHAAAAAKPAAAPVAPLPSHLSGSRGIAKKVAIYAGCIVAALIGFHLLTDTPGKKSAGTTGTATSIPAPPDTSGGQTGNSRLHALRASFACAKAVKWDEVAICGSANLRRADRRMAALYKGRMLTLHTAVERKALKEEQRAWLHSRAACESATNPTHCLTDTIAARISTLSANAPPSQPEQNGVSLTADTQNTGTITPQYEPRPQQGGRCREYHETYDVNGVAKTETKTVCKDANGKWTAQ